MNLINSSIQNLNKSLDFENDILNPFLEKSKKHYPNYIIESKSQNINITLLKQFPKNKYSFEYEEAITLIFKFLKKLIHEYDFIDISFTENSEYGFNPSFKIKVSNSISSRELIKYSDKIFIKVGEFAEINDIEFILDDLSIILCR